MVSSWSEDNDKHGGVAIYWNKKVLLYSQLMAEQTSFFSACKTGFVVITPD